MKRRDFVRKGALATGAALIGFGGEPRRLDGAAGTKRAQDTVTLGRTGLRVTRLAQGTGTSGVGGSSNQTRGLGEQGLADLLVAGVANGVPFWDLADQYGSHPHARRALRTVRRDEVTILTKTHAGTEAEMRADLDRFRREIGTDYIDILLLHNMQSPDWPTEKAGAMAVLSEAKQKGVVRAHGVVDVAVDDRGLAEIAAARQRLAALLEVERRHHFHQRRQDRSVGGIRDYTDHCVLSLHQFGPQQELPEKRVGLRIVPPGDFSDLGVAQRAGDLGHLRVRHYEIETASDPRVHDASWPAGRVHQAGQEDVRVQHRPHRRTVFFFLAALTTSFSNLVPSVSGMLSKALAISARRRSNSLSSLRILSKVSISISAATGFPALVISIRSRRYCTSLRSSPRFWRTVIAVLSLII
jgi:hypothetical protein